jgi:hypothetical protein
MCDAITEDSKTKYDTGKWAIIPGYSKYEISTFGRIKLQNGRISEGAIARSGYRTVSLTSDNGKRHTRMMI